MVYPFRCRLSYTTGLYRNLFSIITHGILMLSGHLSKIKTYQQGAPNLSLFMGRCDVWLK